MEKKEKTFEEKLDRLNQIVDSIEGGSLALEESLKLYEEGKGLVKELKSTLDQAEEKVGKFKEVSTVSVNKK